jgi:hypothetical protein
MNIEELIVHWKEKLKMFENNPHVAKDMDSNIAMGVQHGRTLSLKDCIRELEDFMRNYQDFRILKD